MRLRIDFGQYVFKCPVCASEASVYLDDRGTPEFVCLDCPILYELVSATAPIWGERTRQPRLPAAPEGDWLTQKQAKLEAGNISRETLLMVVKAGLLTEHRLGPHTVRYKRSEVAAYLDRSKTFTAADWAAIRKECPTSRQVVGPPV